MPYASVAQLKAVIPPNDLALLTDFEGMDTPSDARLAQALDDASAEIDSYLGKVIATPLADPPHLLTVLCRDMAMHRLYVNLGHDMTVYDRLRKNATDTLRDIAAGKTAIGDDTGPAGLTSGGVAMTEGPERQMTRDKLEGF